MNLYYDPIMGLRYSAPYPEGPILIVDLSSVPADFCVGGFTKNWKKLLREMPITFHSSSPQEEWCTVVDLAPVITSNHFSFGGEVEREGGRSVVRAKASDYGME